MADNKISVEITLDDGNVSRSFSNIEEQAVKTFASVGKIAAAGAAVAAAAIAGIFTKGSIEAASEFEDALNRFNVSLANSGKFSKEASSSFQDFAQTLQKTTRFSDDQVLSTAALIENLGHLSNDGLKEATKAAIDLSTAMKIDLDTAARLVGKSAEGNVTAFKKFGIEIQKGKTDAETFANTLKALSGISGNAEKDVNTFSGSIAQLKNAFNDVQKSFGAAFVNSPALAAGIKFISDEFLKLSDLIKRALGGEDVLKPIILGIVSIGIALNTVTSGPLEFFYNAGVLAFRTIETIVQSLIVSVTGVGLAITTVLNKIGLASDEAVSIAQTAFSTAKDQLVEFAKETKDASGNLFDFGGTEAGNEFLTNLGNTVAGAQPLQQELINNNKAVGESFKQLASDTAISFSNISDVIFPNARAKSAAELKQLKNDVKNETAQIAALFKNTIGAGVSQAFASFGKAIVAGQNGLKALGQSVLNTLGALAIQLGQFFILVGTGLTATKSLLGVSGAAAIAAGIALSILGGVLQGIAGGGGASAGGGADVSGGGGGAGVTPVENPSLTGQEKIDRGPQVVVNVEGQILDPVGTATRIAELLSDITSSNDITVNA